MKAPRVTQREVAALAGVSQALVSIALGPGARGVPAETVERIQAAAASLGYVPNRFAQALRTSRAMTVACIIPDIANPFYPALIRGVQSVAEAEGYDVIAANTDGASERERALLDWARQGRVDGVVGVFWTLRAEDFRAVLSSGVPVVRFEAAIKTAGELPLDNIFVDSRAGAHAVARHLLGQGHRRIAMVAARGGPQATRIEGYRKALLEAGREPDIVLEDEFSDEGGYRAARAILARAVRPTAIFAANDLMAIGVMQALREAGVAIPDEIAVAGFDDIPAARLVTPALTTVAQFQHDVGARAARILLGRLAADSLSPGTATEMPFRLIERASTAARAP